MSGESGESGASNVAVDERDEVDVDSNGRGFSDCNDATAASRRGTGAESTDVPVTDSEAESDDEIVGVLEARSRSRSLSRSVADVGFVRLC